MIDPSPARIEQRLARVERQNRILVGLLCVMAVVASIGATHAASNVIVADEVRAHRFTLLDPRGGTADDWYTDDPNAPNASHHTVPGYSGWGFHSP
jgi:hypothetical protein